MVTINHPEINKMILENSSLRTELVTNTIETLKKHGIDLGDIEIADSEPLLKQLRASIASNDPQALKCLIYQVDGPQAKLICEF